MIIGDDSNDDEIDFFPGFSRKSGNSRAMIPGEVLTAPGDIEINGKL